ncbi:peptidase M18, aminopeptidase I [Aulographum hederae CBS 113979]|uniref:aspartyl aminopeptidase n=1 Tax=Aulographum hederae CBS 113979 TaxID=1176131 RepID=A0A6G1GTK5_9PEZI|nr:peptidase M18, aminopeptidase I [Aulographum hederae CBS 113979]
MAPPKAPTSQPSLESAEDFLSFVNASPTPFHAVKSAKERLEKAGFKQIKERDSWSSLKPGSKYYLTRNGSSIVAFAIGKKWQPGNPISMIGAHTDSPCLRIKPVSKKQNDGFLQVGVETYGGGLWHTWFDRDLSIAGRAMVKDKDGSITSKLIKVEKPILRVPTLAIHLDRQETFAFNKETQLFPIAGLVAAELNRQGKSEGENVDSKPESTSFEPIKPLTDRHHTFVVELIAKEAGVDPEQIEDFEMVLYDTQKSCIGGLNDELIFSARLDNLMMSFCSTMGIIHSLSSTSALDSDPTIRLIALFDHEEIGSLTAQGADSNLLPSVLRRLSVLGSSDSGSESSDDSYHKVVDTATSYEQSLATSFLISADMAHSVHPNYPAKYESSHRPEMNRGTVIKINANARYATNSPGIVLLQEVARRAKPASSPFCASASSPGVPLQLFVVRNDSSCGSTIGPMLSAALGARTLDLGNPQLSMHSIRETCGAWDVEHAVNLFDSFFVNFGELEKKIVVDE